jgi:lactate dehydrogenase-like 2-hydroxyacid dehydrogenase
MGQSAILALTPGHPGQLEALEGEFRIIRLWKERDPEATIRENALDIQAITTFLAPVRDVLISALPNLEIIAVGAVGIDHIDLVAAKSRNIMVTNTPDVLTEDTADLAFALMMTLSRRVVEGDAFVRAGLWRSQSFPLATSLSGKSLGILGMGRIGRAIALRAEVFNMHIAYSSPNEKTDLDYRYVSDINDLAAGSDFLICACSGGAATHNLVDYNVLGHLGAKGYLVNISRGSVVNEQDLLIALQNRTIAGAALDVYENEPNVPEALFVMDNVVLTPHIGSATIETRRKMGQIVVANIRACLGGEKVLTPVKFG